MNGEMNCAWVQQPYQPTSNRAMFLPSYSFPFSVSVLLMKGLLSFGLPSPEKAEESGAWYQLVVIHPLGPVQLCGHFNSLILGLHIGKRELILPRLQNFS